MRILGIETTCDETGVAVVEDGRKILANITASSVDLHKKYGGVVPEVAAREQVRVIIPVVKECLSSMANRLLVSDEQSTINKIDAIAVAYGPGLVSSLLVGVETAKALALAWNKPLIPINHLIGHVYANWLSVDSSRFTENNSEPLTVNREPKFPLVALIVSGGHTDLILMTGHGKFQWLGGTLDDAAGEVFDKVARVLGLGYPGGPEIEKLAASCQGPETSFHLPRPMINSGDFEFSFSGLKTAVANLVDSSQLTVDRISGIAYEFQKAIVEVLLTKTTRAAQKFKVRSIVVGGGVAANESLRRQLTVHGSQLGFDVRFPSKELAIDNGAMIAAAAYFNRGFIEPLKLQADSSLYF